MVSSSVFFQTKYNWIVLLITVVAITTKVWCLIPRCRPESDHLYIDEGKNGGFNTFKWYKSNIPGTLSTRYLNYNRVYSTNFQFNGSCTIKAIGVSFVARGKCRVSISIKEFDHNGWSNTRPVWFTDHVRIDFHYLHFYVQSSHGLKIKFTVESEMTRPLSQCTFQLNEAREPFIALHVQEDHDECSASNHPCYGYYNPLYCTNTWGSFSCTRTCPHGYRHGYSYICNDINECAWSSTPCYGYIRRDNEPNCVNTPGAYQCICRQGYEIVKKGHRFQCQDIDECSLTPHHCVAYSAQGPRRCVDSMGSYSCNCVEGYIAQDTSNRTICVGK
ncbi:protein kinase C-binding protein NELL2-like [Sycon ciliatum]|uniref:protein kinase C-binding protein NELL2-like n=1 Tax=Sycon ciliatum TaxID=27933 RepID=UPI0031F6DC15